ncbi:MAG TPA: hypothetical protein VGY66_33890 [Gemmataceae bacterium]|nr:hypothetical protein [Gemmataceae bacterium]
MRISKLLGSLGLRDKLLVACVISLIVAAHFLPVCELVAGSSLDEDYWYITGWNLPADIFWFYECFATDAWQGAPIERERWLGFVAYLSNPLLILGGGTLLIGYRARSRASGFISAFMGISALACPLALLFIYHFPERSRLFVGFYVWLAASVTLTAAGFCRAWGGICRPAPVADYARKTQ